MPSYRNTVLVIGGEPAALKFQFHNGSFVIGFLKSLEDPDRGQSEHLVSGC